MCFLVFRLLYLHNEDNVDDESFVLFEKYSLYIFRKRGYDFFPGTVCRRLFYPPMCLTTVGLEIATCVFSDVYSSSPTTRRLVSESFACLCSCFSNGHVFGILRTRTALTREFKASFSCGAIGT